MNGFVFSTAILIAVFVLAGCSVPLSYKGDCGSKYSDLKICERLNSESKLIKIPYEYAWLKEYSLNPYYAFEIHDATRGTVLPLSVISHKEDGYRNEKVAEFGLRFLIDLKSNRTVELSLISTRGNKKIYSYLNVGNSHLTIIRVRISNACNDNESVSVVEEANNIGLLEENLPEWEILVFFTAVERSVFVKTWYNRKIRLYHYEPTS